MTQLTLSLIILKVCSFSAVAKDEPLVPKSLAEVGFLTAQPAVVFKKGTHLLYFRAEAYRKRHPEFAHLNDADLRRVALLNASYITTQQTKWDGILMRIMTPPEATRIVFNGPDNGRGSYSGMLQEEELREPILPPLGKGKAERKGTGITAATEGTQEMWISMHHGLTGVPPRFDVLSAEGRAAVSKMREASSKNVAQLQAKRVDADLDLRSAIDHELSRMEADNRLIELFLRGLTEKDAKGAPDAATIGEFTQILRQRDYTNGLLEAARALVEAMLFEVFDDVYGVLNSVWGTSFGVVEVDLVATLPIQMHSIAYGREMTAGVLEREATWRGNTLGTDIDKRYWTPRDIIFSEGDFIDQLDVNGRNIDLEMMMAKIPGIEEFFRLQFQGFYGRELHRRCVDTTEAAIAGDETAVPKLIAELKSKINRAALIEWAKKNPPPKTIGKDAFTEARQLFQGLGKRDGTGGHEFTPVPKHQQTRLKKLLLDLRQAGHTEQITALWPEVYRRAPDLARQFFEDSVQVATQALKRAQKREKRGVEKEFKMIDVSYLGNLVSMMIFEWQSGDPLAPVKLQYARYLHKASPEIFLVLYSKLMPEFYRRVLSQHSLYRHDFFEGHPHYELAKEIFGRISLAMMIEHNPKTASPVSMDSLFAPIQFMGEPVDFRQALLQLVGSEPMEILAAVEAVEHALGAEMSDELLNLLFPGQSIRVGMQLRLQRRMQEMSPAAQLRCIMGLAGAAGLLEGEGHDYEALLAPGSMLSRLFGDKEPPTPGRALPPANGGLLPPGPPPKALPPAKPKNTGE